MFDARVLAPCGQELCEHWLVGRHMTHVTDVTCISQHAGLQTSSVISSDENSHPTIINRFITCSSAALGEADLFVTPVGVSVRTNRENY